MTPRAWLIFWLGAFLVLSGISSAIALVLTHPDEEPEATTVALVYASRATHLMAPPTLQLHDQDAQAIDVVVQPRDVPAHLLLAVGGAGSCMPRNDVDGAASRVVPSPVSANEVGDANIRPVRAFAVVARIEDASFVCRLGSGATPDAFSGRRFAVAANPRFVDVAALDGCVRTAKATSGRVCPLETYRFDYTRLEDPDDLRVTGGKELADEPDARLLTSNAARIRLRWRNDYDDHWRELFLFVDAGAFALGLSALLEAAKAGFDLVEERRSARGDATQGTAP